MAWQDVVWVNGEVIAEQKINQMQTNTEYVRDEVGVKFVCGDAMSLWGENTHQAGTSGHVTTGNVVVKVDGAQVGTGTWNEGEAWDVVDIDLSGIATGLHYVTVDTDVSSTIFFAFYRSPDANRLSVWGTIYISHEYDGIGLSYTAGRLRLSGAAVTRESMGW